MTFLQNAEEQRKSKNNNTIVQHDYHQDILPTRYSSIQHDFFLFQEFKITLKLINWSILAIFDRLDFKYKPSKGNIMDIIDVKLLDFTHRSAFFGLFERL